MKIRINNHGAGRQHVRRLTKKKMSKTRTEKKEMLLKCDLTNAERICYGLKMADAQQEADEMQAQIDALKKEYNGKIEVKRTEACRIGGIIRQGYEHRMVKCEVTYDYDSGMMTLTRLDTGEVENMRPMTADELSRLPFGIDDEEGDDKK